MNKFRLTILRGEILDHIKKEYNAAINLRRSLYGEGSKAEEKYSGIAHSYPLDMGDRYTGIFIPPGAIFELGPIDFEVHNIEGNRALRRSC